MWHDLCYMCYYEVPILKTGHTTANDDDRDSRDLPCTCAIENPSTWTSPQVHCRKHGIAASNARENRYWQRVGRD